MPNFSNGKQSKIMRSLARKWASVESENDIDGFIKSLNLDEAIVYLDFALKGKNSEEAQNMIGYFMSTLQPSVAKAFLQRELNKLANLGFITPVSFDVAGNIEKFTFSQEQDKVARRYIRERRNED